MRTTWLHRLEKLEARTESEKLPFLRYGWLKPLPQEFSGERHVVIVKREPTGSPRVEWCEFEERAGPALANGTGNDAVRICSPGPVPIIIQRSSVKPNSPIIDYQGFKI
jgi:hypothetical protein